MSTVLYCRTANGGANAMALQVVALNQYALEMGYIPFMAYCDMNESGATLDRPGMQKLLADIRACKVKRIIVKDLLRLSRNISQLHDLLNLFNDFDVEIVSFNDGGVVDRLEPDVLANANPVFAMREKRLRAAET